MANKIPLYTTSIQFKIYSPSFICVIGSVFKTGIEQIVTEGLQSSSFLSMNESPKSK